MAWAGGKQLHLNSLAPEPLCGSEFYGTLWFFFMANCDCGLVALPLDFQTFDIDKAVGCSWALTLWKALQRFKDLFKPNSPRLVQQALGTFEVCFANLLNAFWMLVCVNETNQGHVQQALGTFEDWLQKLTKCVLNDCHLITMLSCTCKNVITNAFIWC